MTFRLKTSLPIATAVGRCDGQGPSLPAGKRNSLVMFFDEILPAKISRGTVRQLQRRRLLALVTDDGPAAERLVAHVWFYLIKLPSLSFTISSFYPNC